MRIKLEKLDEDHPLRKKAEEALQKEREEEFKRAKQKAENRTQDTKKKTENNRPRYDALDLLKPITEMELQRTFHVKPTPAPRQSRSDAWDPRPCVKRYRAFCDEIALKLDGFEMPLFNWHVIFYYPMPEYPSWSKKKRRRKRGTFHQQTPDKDNLEKAFMDALFRCYDRDDKEVADGRVTKVWTASNHPKIEVYF